MRALPWSRRKTPPRLVPFRPGFIAGDRRRMRQLGWDEEGAAAGLRLIRQALVERGA
jgi:hypothetical protein